MIELDEHERMVILAAGEFEPDAHSPGELIRFAEEGAWDEEFFEWWLPQQSEWQLRAATVLTKLETHDPLPTREAVINGAPSLPEWSLQWWARVLRFPWAARLGEAVEAAEAWYDSKPIVYK